MSFDAIERCINHWHEDFKAVKADEVATQARADLEAARELLAAIKDERTSKFPLKRTDRAIAAIDRLERWGHEAR